MAETSRVYRETPRHLSSAAEAEFEKQSLNRSAEALRTQNTHAPPALTQLESEPQRKLNLARSSGSDRANRRGGIDRSDDAAEARSIRWVESRLRRT
jgi:hypothetical protein